MRVIGAGLPRTVLPDRLLVFQVRDGWEPLCAFLGCEVPCTEFPHLNKRATVGRRVRDLFLSIPLDLFAMLHFFYATLFFVGPATDLGGLIWFPFYSLGASCLVLAWGIWVRRSWSKFAGIAVSVLFPIIFSVGFWREWHADSWSVLGYGFSLLIVAPVYVIELAGIWLLVPNRKRIIDAMSLSGQANSRLFEPVMVMGLLALAVLTDCVMPRRPNLYPILVTAIGLLPAILGLYMLMTNEESVSRPR